MKPILNKFENACPKFILKNLIIFFLSHIYVMAKFSTRLNLALLTQPKLKGLKVEEKKTLPCPYFIVRYFNTLIHLISTESEYIQYSVSHLCLHNR